MLFIEYEWRLKNIDSYDITTTFLSHIAFRLLNNAMNKSHAITIKTNAIEKDKWIKHINVVTFKVSFIKII